MSHPWWHSAVFYQIYPLTFQDSNGADCASSSTTCRMYG